MGNKGEPHFGHGRWPKKQFYAIVLGYRARGREPEWVARKLGAGIGSIERIYEYGTWLENEAYDELVRSSGRNPEEPFV